MTALSPNPFQWDFVLAIVLGVAATILAVALDYPDPWRIVVLVALALAGACAVVYDRRRHAGKDGTPARSSRRRRRTNTAIRLTCTCRVCRAYEARRLQQEQWLCELPPVENRRTR